MNINKNLFFQLAFCLFVLTITSCGPSNIFEKNYEIANKTWLYRDTLNFDVAINDIATPYNVFLDVTHNADFGNENAYVTIFVKSPDGKRTSNQVSVEMADKIGQWRGKCSGGSCSLHIPLQENAKFPQKGTYIFTIAQNNRIDSLNLIEKVGLSIAKSEQ